MPTYRNPTDGCHYVTPRSFTHSEPRLDPPEDDDGCPHCGGEVTQDMHGVECDDEDCGWSFDGDPS